MPTTDASGYQPGFFRRLARAFRRFGDKPLTFLFLGTLLTAQLTGAAVLLFPADFFGAGHAVSGSHPAIRIPLSVFLLTLSAWPVAAMAFAAAYKIRGLKPLGHGLGRTAAVVETLLGAIAVLVAPLLLVFPGIVMEARFCLALPVIVNEKKTGLAALKRSSDLVKGSTAGMSWGLLLIGLTAALAAAAAAAAAATCAHQAAIGGILSGPRLAAFRISAVALPIAALSVVFLPILTLYLQISYEGLIKTRRLPVTSPDRNRLALYGVLAAIGTLMVTGAGAAGIVTHPELTVDRVETASAASTAARRGPADTDEIAVAARGPEKPKKEETARDRDWRRYQDVSAIRAALQRRHNDVGGYPESLADLVPGYLEKIPADPHATHKYRYSRTRDSFNIDFVIEEGVRDLTAGRYALTRDGFESLDGGGPAATESSDGHAAQ